MSWTYDQSEICDWLKAHCADPGEYGFWYTFYDDLEDCFNGLEPWELFGEDYIKKERARIAGRSGGTWIAQGDGYMKWLDL